MKRREFLRVGAVAAVAGPGVARPAIAQTAPEVKWRLTSSFTKSIDTLYGAGQTLGRYVAEATDGKFQIQTYAAGELATSRQALEAVTSGAVECAHTPLSFHTSKELALGAGAGLPFGLNIRQQQAWWSSGGGGELINGILKKLNAYGLPAGGTGGQMGGWFKKEVTGIEDLKGLRFRISGMGAPIAAKLGVVPYEMSYADVLGSMESGNIDGAEFLCAHDDDRLGIVKLAKHNHYPCWWESAGMVHFVANLEKWNALPKAYQAVLARACDATTAWTLARYDAVNPPALKRLVAAGAVIKPFPQPVLEACFRAANEHFAELAAKDALFKRTLDSITAYRKDHHHWWQIADYAIDTFVIGMRGRV